VIYGKLNNLNYDSSGQNMYVDAYIESTNDTWTP